MRSTKQEGVSPSSSGDREANKHEQVKYRRSWALVCALDDIRHTPTGRKQVPSRWRFYLGIGLLVLSAFFLGPGIWQTIRGDDPFGGPFIVASLVTFVVGMGFVIWNLSDNRFIAISLGIDRQAHIGRMVVWGLSFVGGVLAVGSSLILLLVPAPLEPGGLFAWILTLGETSRSEPIPSWIALLVGLWQFVLVMLMLPLGIAQQPLVSLSHRRRDSRITRIAWGHFLVAATVAIAVVATIRVIVVRVTGESQITVVVTLTVTLLSLVCALAGRHAAELRQRRARATELLDEIIEQTSQSEDRPSEDISKLLSRLERESRFPSGGWWWHPDPELFDDALLDLFRLLAPESNDERPGVARLRRRLGKEKVTLILSLVNDLRDSMMALYPQSPGDECKAPVGSADGAGRNMSPEFQVDDRITHERFGEGIVTHVIGRKKRRVARVRFEWVGLENSDGA